MGRQAASARRQLQLTSSVMRSLLFTAVLASACLALGLQVGLLSPLPNVVLTPAAAATTVTAPAGLAVRTIVAYSLEAQLHQTPLPACLSPGPRLPLESPISNNDLWQTPSSDTYLLNAYYDTRVHSGGRAFPTVRIIAMMYGNSNATNLYCQVWFESSVEPVITRALRTEIWAQQWDAGNFEQVYRPFLLSCTIGHISDQVPSAVSVVEGEPCGPASTLLPLAPPAASPRHNIVAVCVKGLDFADDRSIRLVEWLEMTRLLGATKVFMYLYHVHPNMRRVLEYYQRLGHIAVIPLTLPGQQPNIPTQRTRYLRDNIWQKRRNELISYNDCLYRNLDYQFILPLDMDEIIVPVKTRTWTKMLNQLFQKNPNMLKDYASFSVQNAYFFDTFGSFEQVDKSVPKYLHMLRHIERSANFSPSGQSVKSFVSTQTTLTVFNHYALHALYPAMQPRLVLDRNLVQMNHYQKQCSPFLSADCNSNFVRFHKPDRLLSRYKHVLQARVTSVLQTLQLI